MATLSTIHAHDIVEVEVKGRHTHAIVTGKGPGKLSIRPINDRTWTWREVTARQVVKHWRLTKNVRQ